MIKKMFLQTIIVIVLVFLVGCSGGGPAVSDSSFDWSYVRSPSGRYYEVGTYSSVGGYSYAVSGLVDARYCEADSGWTWSYIKSPSGKCYEVGTHSSVGGFSYTISSQVEDSHCSH
jgi:hypothetical protein